MAQYSITYSCGHSGTVNLNGPGKSREWQIRKMESGLCPDCLADRRAGEAAAAAKESAEDGLPELTGTEKQVEWAERCRANFMKSVKKLGPVPAKWRTVDAYLRSIRSASWWIEHRNHTPGTVFPLLREQAEAWHEKRQLAAADRQDMEAVATESGDVTLRPQGEPQTETVVAMTVLEESIEIVPPEFNDDFTQQMRRLNFTWQRDARTYRIKYAFRFGEFPEFAAYAASALLSAGFVVRVPREVARRIGAGGIKPPPAVWILRKGQTFAVYFDRDRGDFYHEIRRIPGCRWTEGSGRVGVEHFADIIDFAEQNQAFLSPGARKLIELGKSGRSAQVETVPELPAERFTAPDTVPGVLDMPETVEVPEALRDEI